MKTLQRTALISMTCMALLAPWNANAQGAYPNKPIRVIVPFAPGSTLGLMPTVTETLDPEVLVLMSLGVMVSIFISDSVRMSLKLSVSKPKTKYVRIKNLKTGGERAGESDVTPEFLEKRTYLGSNAH